MDNFPVQLIFRDIVAKNGRSLILKSVSGIIRPRALTGIFSVSRLERTTLLTILADRSRLYSKGSIYFNSKLIDDKYVDIARYVGCNYEFYSSFTVCETLEFYCRLKYGYSKAVVKQKVVEIMYLFDILNKKDVRIENLNNNERTCIAIAIEFIFNPSLIFVDLGPANCNQEEVRNIFQSVRKVVKKGHAVVMSVENLTWDSASFFDQIIIIENSVITFSGNIKNCTIFFGVGFIADSNKLFLDILCLDGNFLKRSKMYNKQIANDLKVYDEISSIQAYAEPPQKKHDLSAKGTTVMLTLVSRTYTNIYRNPAFSAGAILQKVVFTVIIYIIMHAGDPTLIIFTRIYAVFVLVFISGLYTICILAINLGANSDLNVRARELKSRVYSRQTAYVSLCIAHVLFIILLELLFVFVLGMCTELFKTTLETIIFATNFLCLMISVQGICLLVCSLCSLSLFISTHVLTMLIFIAAGIDILRFAGLELLHIPMYILPLQYISLYFTLSNMRANLICLGLLETGRGFIKRFYNSDVNFAIIPYAIIFVVPAIYVVGWVVNKSNFTHSY